MIGKKFLQPWLLLSAIIVANVGVWLWISGNPAQQQSESDGSPEPSLLSTQDKKGAPRRMPPPAELPRDSKPAKRDYVTAPGGLDPEKAALLLKQSGSRFPDITERCFYCAGIIRSLCEAGYSEEAWSMIEPSAGMLRNGQLSQFFASSQMDEDMLIAKMKEIPTEAGLSALGGFIRRYPVNELKGLIESGKLQNALGNQLQHSDIEGSMEIAVMLAASKVAAKDRPQMMAVASDLYHSGLMSDRAFYNILNKDRMGDAFERWQMLDAIGFTSDGRDQKYRDAMISNMMDKDPLRTIGLLNSDTSTLSDFKAGIESWLQIDSGGASNWYRENSASLDPKRRDTVAAAHVSLALEISELSSAAEWLNQISDPEMKSQLAQRLADLHAKSNP
jgi:hypothetical protein